MIAGIVVLILYRLNRKIGIASGAWILHILMDIPVHTQEYFPTPFLFPLSDFTVNGVSSINLWIANWVALIIGYTYYYGIKRKVEDSRPDEQSMKNIKEDTQ